MNNITHNQFMTTFEKEMRGNYAANQAQEIIIMGAVALFWEHSKNIAYLNHAMQYARGRRGIRVNAVKAFIVAFTGAVYKGKGFTGGGRAMKKLPNLFFFFDSWTEWADDNAAEPTYDHKAFVLKLETYLGKRVEEAEAAGDTATANVVGTMLTMAKQAEA